MTKLSELSDIDFNGASLLIVGNAESNATEWKLDEDYLESDVDPLKLAWESALAANSNPQTQNKTTTAEKNAARAAYEPVLRSLILSLQNNHNVSENDLIEMGINIEPHSNQPLPATDEEVEIKVELDAIRRVTGNFKPKGSPNKGKPHGVASMEMRHGILKEDPAEVEDLPEVDIYTRSPFILEFKESDRGKRVYMCGRWIMRNGKPGPWGEIVWSVIP